MLCHASSCVMLLPLPCRVRMHAFTQTQLDCHPRPAGAVELRNEVGRRMGCDLPGTLVFDYPTSAAIAGYLADRLAPALADSGAGSDSMVATAAQPGVQVSRPVSAQPPPQQVLITDARSRFGTQPPLGPILPAGEDAIRPVPLDRWDPDFGRSLPSFARGSSTSKGSSGLANAVRFGGFVLSWAVFDAEAFAVSPSGACVCCLVHMLLQLVYPAHERHILLAPRHRPCRGCFVGPPAACASGGVCWPAGRPG